MIMHVLQATALLFTGFQAGARSGRAVSSSLVSRPRTNASLRTSITCSRSASDARMWPLPFTAAIWSPGLAATSTSYQDNVCKTPGGRRPPSRSHHSWRQKASLRGFPRPTGSVGAGEDQPLAVGGRLAAADARALLGFACQRD